MILRWLPATAALALTGCMIDGSGPESSNPPRHEFRAIDHEKLERLKVHLKMGAGDLQAAGGTEKLMAADFTYGKPSMKPEVRYNAIHGEGDLSIEQPSENGAHIAGTKRYEWDIRLARDVPMDLSMQFGAGKAQLDLGSLDLNSVEIEMGVGDLTLDLRGQPKHDYTVRIRGGVGQATVRLSADTGVTAEVQGGIGSIEAPGLIRHGNHIENEALGKSKATIHLDVQGGIGAIKLLTD